ncbi:MAG: molybdopterin-dependent oxidoreductase [Solirubrobacteraceae bacterium]|nr:molybdopterin-dependent oxidoreductase [Solirubrobacteraceae bacterium]
MSYEHHLGRGRTTRDHDVPQDDSALEVSSEGPLDHAVGRAASVSIAKQGMRHLGVTRSARSLLKMNQPQGFDCPGCAWPEPEQGAHHLEFCENGVKAVAEEATLRRIGRSFFERHSVADLGERTGYWLGQQGRLTEPMYLAPGATHYAPIGWDDAYAVIADELRALDSPDEVAFYTSGRTSNEAAYLYQLLARALGTNNLPDCSNMCHESSGVALAETIGIGKGSVTVNDLVMADLIVIAGQNPGTNHPRMLTTLEEAKQRGTKILTINPLPEAGLARFDNPQTVSGMLGHGTQLTDEFLQIKVGGDHALFRALVHCTFLAEAAAPGTVLDHEFLASSTTGLAELEAELGVGGARSTDAQSSARSTSRVADLEADLGADSPFDWPETERATGLTRAEIESAAELLLAHDKVVVCWAMGLTQHKASVPTIREIVNLLLLRGQIGRPGAGLCPVRGHSNVQGDRTMGIWERPNAWFLDALDSEFGIQTPREDGFDVVETIHAMDDGRLKVFMAMGGNFASATPDTAVTEAAIRRLRLTVQVSTKLNRSHAVTGQAALILPALGRTDRDESPRGKRVQAVTVEDSMSVVHATRGHLPPPSDDVRSEPRIICELAQAVFGDGDARGALPAGGGVAERAATPPWDTNDDRWAAPDGAARAATARAIPWDAFVEDYALVRQRIERTIPGFEQFEDRIRLPGGFVLPHAPRDHRTFDTPDGKAHLTVNPLRMIEVPDGHLLLQTLRSHDQYNTTIYGLDDRYRGITGGRRVLFVRPSDLDALGFADGDMVDLVADQFDDTVRRADGFRLVAYPTARGCAAAYYPETNPLVPLRSTADESRTPTSKSVVIRLERATTHP